MFVRRSCIPHRLGTGSLLSVPMELVSSRPTTSPKLSWRCRPTLRLPRLKTDLLVSINTPLPSGVRDAEELSPLADAATRASRVRALESELAGRFGDKEMATTRLLCRVAKSLRIHNTGLFVV